MTASVVFVTASYRLDREHCALLNRSLEACAPSFEHWIVVDREDLPLFRPLANNRTNIVAKEEVLPVWVRRVDTLKIGLRSNAWLQMRGLPIRGWLLQQLVKLAVAERLSADVLVHADSDVVLIRPFTTEAVIDREGRIRMYELPDRVDAALPNHVRWHRSAEKLLDIDSAPLPMPDFISSLVPWKRQNAVALLEHVERTTGTHWFRALAHAWHVSEFTLYGRFVRDVLAGNGGQFVASAPLCLDYYKRVPLSVPELTAFLDRVDNEAIAVSLTSKAGMKPSDYVDLLERRWAVSAPVGPVGIPAKHPDAAPGGTGVFPKETATGSPAAKDEKSTVSRASRRARPRRVLEGRARFRVVAAIAALLSLMIVLVGFGID